MPTRRIRSSSFTIPNGYTYKVVIGVLVYLLAGLIALGIAWITMGFQSVKAAIANPVHSLRSE